MRGRKPLEGPLKLNMWAYIAVPNSWSDAKKAKALAGEIRPVGKPDFDNIIKALADAMNKIVWLDDAQVVEIYAFKFYNGEPRVVLEVTPL